MPICPPKQAPQVGVETAAPASANTSSSPSASAARQMRCVAGTTTSRTCGATFRPRSTSAAWRRSVSVPVEQLPM